MKYLLILIVLFFTSCNSIQEKVKNTLQSENAKQITNDYHEIIKLLTIYKIKLDKRNPKSYGLGLGGLLRENISKNTNTINLIMASQNTPKQHTDYLNYAFNKEVLIENRNDYLIMGLYKMFYSAYNMDLKYKLY
jgi:hypothetical protein